MHDILKDIDSTQIPAWVRWLAQDADGSWWAYEHEPNQGDKGWYENEAGRSIKMADGSDNLEWKTTIFSVR